MPSCRLVSAAFASLRRGLDAIIAIRFLELQYVLGVSVFSMAAACVYLLAVVAWGVLKVMSFPA